jgi:hypothetical protein
VHCPRLPSVPLPRLRQAVQRAQHGIAEPDPVSFRCHRPRRAWRLRYKLSLRDLAEMFLIRGIAFSYEAVRDWEDKLTPALAVNLRRRRRGKVGRSWYVDETYVKVQGRWCYLYRAIDTSGAPVDVRLSKICDMAAPMAFFHSAKTVSGHAGPDHHGWARQLPKGNPKRTRRRRSPSDQSLSQQPDRAGSSRHQGPIPADARVQERPLLCDVLSKLRRTAKLSPPPLRPQQSPPTARPLPFPHGDQHPAGHVMGILRTAEQIILVDASADRTGNRAWPRRHGHGGALLRVSGVRSISVCGRA